MGLLDKLRGYKQNIVRELPEDEIYEFCPRCDANLTLQKGYRNDLPYWNCKGCGEMLINPEVDAADDIAWICDQCGSMLNIQEGFSDNNGEWICTECGYINRIDESELYASEDEFQAERRSPYKGLSDEDALALSLYWDIEHIDDRPDIILVKHCETGRKFIKKLLTTYNKSIYDYLKDNPVKYTPVIHEIYEGENYLIVVEECIEGKTIADLLEDNAFSEERIAITYIECVRREAR